MKLNDGKRGVLNLIGERFIRDSVRQINDVPSVPSAAISKLRIIIEIATAIFYFSRHMDSVVNTPFMPLLRLPECVGKLGLLLMLILSLLIWQCGFWKYD